MILSGLARLGRDAELRYAPTGDAVTSLALAFSHGKKGTDGHRETQWVEASLWGKQAESLVKYLLKGKMISVVIEYPHIQVFKKGDGEQGFKMVGRVMSIEFVGGDSQSAKIPATDQKIQGQYEPGHPKPYPPDTNNYDCDPVDDLPF